MKSYTVRQFVKESNFLAKEGVPFFFTIAFDLKSFFLAPVHEIDRHSFAFKFNGKSNIESPTFPQVIASPTPFDKYPESYDNYLKGYKKVAKHIQLGNSFLLNYTCRTPIRTQLTLLEIFQTSRSKYAVWFKDIFTFFSPETFISTKENAIITNPMKGTIDANLPNAKDLLLHDEKETAEHYTIVDLLRNDLAMVAKNVAVRRFKYLELLSTNAKSLYQMSSEITGELPHNWQDHLGDILLTLLPAGSVTGAPKKKTISIIQSAEKHPRGFYTGISGYFDGKELDTCVNIRFIEQENGTLYYRSGGGITCNSQPEKEYKEMIDKIYLSV